MGWKRNIAAAVMAVGFGLAAGSVTAAPASPAQCKKTCNSAYQGCLKKSSQEACTKSWVSCKKKCAPAPAKSTPAPTTPAPKKG